MSIPASVPPPTGPRGFQSKGGPRAQRAEKERKFGTPLPLLLPESQLYAAATGAAGPSSLKTRSTIISASALIAPQAVGVLDRASASVWVEDTADMEMLFNRGFFGKGTLSRSDPNWRSRRIELMQGGSGE
jgi:tRNA-splicing endonuclease subunit Sen2